MVCITTKEKPELKVQTDDGLKKLLIFWILLIRDIQYASIEPLENLHCIIIMFQKSTISFWNDIILKCEILNEFLKELQ